MMRIRKNRKPNLVGPGFNPLFWPSRIPGLNVCKKLIAKPGPRAVGRKSFLHDDDDVLRQFFRVAKIPAAKSAQRCVIEGNL